MYFYSETFLFFTGVYWMWIHSPSQILVCWIFFFIVSEYGVKCESLLE